jgi:hypothetical protein
MPIYSVNAPIFGVNGNVGMASFSTDADCHEHFSDILECLELSDWDTDIDCGGSADIDLIEAEIREV